MPELMAWHKDRFTGEVWDFTAATAPGGSNPDDVTREYFLVKSIKFNAVADGFGRLMLFFPTEHNNLRTLMQIRNLRDAGGLEIIPNGIWLMTEYEPVLDTWGRVSGYRSRVSVNVTPGE